MTVVRLKPGCPTCNHPEFEVWTSLSGSVGEYLECLHCGTSLSRDGKSVLRGPLVANVSPSDAAQEPVKKRRRKRPKPGKKADAIASQRAKVAPEGQGTSPASTSEPHGEANLPAPTATDEEWEALRAQFSFAPHAISKHEDVFTVVLKSPKQRYFKMIAHDLTEDFSFPKRCIYTGKTPALDTETIKASNSDVTITLTVPVSAPHENKSAKKSKSTKSNGLEFVVDEDAGSIAFTFSHFAVFQSFLEENLTPKTAFEES